MNAAHTHTIQLSKEELSQIQSVIRRGTHKARVITRARILLWSHEGKSKAVIAPRLLVNMSTVQDVRDRFREGGLERALHDAPRSGQPPKLNDKREARLVAIACSPPPEGTDHWTLELLQEKLIEDGVIDRISTVAIWYHLRNRGIQPWREKNVVRAHD